MISSSLGHISCSLNNRFPFLKEKMSDEATFTPCVIETLSLLGRMVVTTSARVCCQIASSVGCLYEGKGTDEVQLPEGN